MPEAWLPPSWSKSSLGTLLDGCAWQWALTKVFGMRDEGSPATVRGTALHAAIEHHERARLRRYRDGERDPLPDRSELHDLAVEVLAVEAAKLPPDVWDRHGTDLARTEAEVGHLLDNWSEGILPHLLAMRPVAVEPYFRADLEWETQRPGHGYIDEVLWDPTKNQWVVVDHKSAGNFRRWEGVAGHEVEGAMYVAGAMLAKHLPVSGPTVRMEWHVVRPLKASSRTGDLARIVDWELDLYEARARAAWTVREAEEQVVQGWLPKNTDWNLCSAKWCAFYWGCEVTGELAPETLLDQRGQHPLTHLT